MLYAHFENREGIVDAVAMEGFEELGLLLEKARTKARRGGAIGAVAKAYLHFASSSPAVYESMFSRRLGVPFDREAMPTALRLAFAPVLALFDGQDARRLVLAELFWASLHGVAELARTHRLPSSRQKDRVRTLAALFSAQASR